MSEQELADQLRVELTTALEARIHDLQQQIERLSKRLDSIGDYAGHTEYMRKQDAIVANARLARLEDKHDTVDN